MFVVPTVPFEPSSSSSKVQGPLWCIVVPNTGAKSDDFSGQFFSYFEIIMVIMFCFVVAVSRASIIFQKRFPDVVNT